MAKTTTISSIPVRAIPVPNTNKLILAGPCIVLRTATVAEALRQERKLEAAITTTTASSTTTNSSTSTTPAALTHRTAASKTPQSPELLRCKRRADIGRLGFPEAKPASVSRRNARERNRVKLVNLGFETLREHVPNGKKNRKMSKVETLRSAVEYIRQMQQMLRDYDAETGSVTEKVLINIDDSDNTIGGGCSSSDEDNGMCGEVPLVLAPAGAATSVPATIVADASTTTCATTTVGVAPVVTTIGGCEKMIIDSVNNNNNNNNSIINNNSIKVVNLNKNSISIASAGKNNTGSNNTTKDVSNLNFINLLPAPALANAGSQTFTVFTLPFHQSLSPNLITDEIFISNSSVPQNPSILTSSGINALSGNITTFTNLQTLATLSGTRGISLSFAGPVQDLHQKQPQQQQQQHQQQNISVTSTEQCHPGVTACIDQQEQLLQHQHNEQHNHQQQLMSLPDAPTSSSSSLSRIEDPTQHTTTLLCDATFLPQQQQQHQLSMMHHQMQQPMDQVPSPCLSTASSSPSETSSESSYEYYEALEGSLEEDLQDISNWITELCSAQDMQAHGEY